MLVDGYYQYTTTGVSQTPKSTWTRLRRRGIQLLRNSKQPLNMTLHNSYSKNMAPSPQRRKVRQRVESRRHQQANNIHPRLGCSFNHLPPPIFSADHPQILSQPLYSVHILHRINSRILLLASSSSQACAQLHPLQSSHLMPFRAPRSIVQLQLTTNQGGMTDY
jgi:hypothetical protein